MALMASTTHAQALSSEVEGRAFLQIVAVPVMHGRHACLDMVEDLRHDKARDTNSTCDALTIRSIAF